MQPSAPRDSTDTLSRRRMLGAAGSAVAGLAATPMFAAAAEPAAESAPAAGKATESRIRAAVIGTGGRGTFLAERFARQPNTEVVYVADVDIDRAGKAAAAVGAIEGVARPPEAIADFRRCLDDKTIDVVVVATTNHWHAPAAILACTAGKHVYVEKPCSHNPWEGETLVAAARKHDRRVQMGNQRRTWSGIRKAMEELRDGVIGRPYLVQSYFNSNRPSIGRGKEAPVPKNLDWDLWQGPAPRTAFRDNYLHYNWHWFWKWGNGELGNNGVHGLDVCRWGMGLEYPVLVESAGGRYRFDDDQQTPDTHFATYTFADKRTITWQGLSCSMTPEGAAHRADEIFYGDKGSMSILGAGYTIFDPEGKEVRKERGDGGEDNHIANLLAAIRHGTPLTSEIEQGHISTLLCHLGNIAYRLGRPVRCDPSNGHVLGDAEAQALWKPPYEPGWEPKV
jgi:predicted dehydrogenase